MFNGYSKTLFGDDNTFLSNVKAISGVIDKYNFRKISGLVCVLEGFQTNIMLFYGNTSRIIIHFRIDTEIDPEYVDEVTLKLMRLNNTYGLNLSLDNSMRITCDHTIFARPHPISADCFTAVYESFLTKIEAVRGELISLAGKYAVSFMDQNLEETASEVQDDLKEELKEDLKQRLKEKIEEDLIKIIAEKHGIEDSDDDADDIAIPDDDDIFSLFDNDPDSFSDD